MQMPSENDTHLTTPPFCSLRVGVALPVDVASVRVKASSNGGRMMKVAQVQVGDGQGGGGEEGGGEEGGGEEGGGEEGGGEEGGGEEGGGSGACTDCEEHYIACLEVSCDNQVTGNDIMIACNVIYLLLLTCPHRLW